MKKKIEQYSYEVQKQKKSYIKISILFTILSFISINLIFRFLAIPVRQNSVSMLPDIGEDSIVLTSPLCTNYERGDVVLINPKTSILSTKVQDYTNIFVRFFTGQQISLVEHQEFPGTKNHLRRIVAVPGDTFYMRDYVLYIKPKGEKHFLTEFELSKKAYNVTFYSAPASWDGGIGLKGSFDEITLKNNEYFVLSDNRISSDDSRLWGIISRENIKSKAVLSYFPFSQFKIF